MQKITVDAKGEVRYSSGLGGDNTLLSIDGIYFSVDDSTGVNQWHNIDLHSEFQASGLFEVQPRARIWNNLVHLSGLVPTKQPHISGAWYSLGSVPAGTEPAWKVRYSVVAGSAAGVTTARLEITPLGGIEVYVAADAKLFWVSLDGIMYPVASIASAPS